MYMYICYMKFSRKKIKHYNMNVYNKLLNLNLKYYTVYTSTYCIYDRYAETIIGALGDPWNATFRWVGTGQALTQTANLKDKKQPTKACSRAKGGKVHGTDCQGETKNVLCQAGRGRYQGDFSFKSNRQ